MNKEEIWKSVEDSNEKYQVSNFGRVKSFKQNKNGVIMSGTITTTGYHKYSIMINNKYINIRTNRLVALHFVPNPNNYPLVDHINGNILDNTVENLRWVDYTQNCLNTKIRTDNSSGFKGVFYNTLTKRWVAQCVINGKKTSKTFIDKNEAIDCRKAWVTLHYPEAYCSIYDTKTVITLDQNELDCHINIENEEWVYVNDSDNIYLVSNMGRIKSFQSNSKGKILKGNVDSNGYIRYNLIIKSISTHITIHRIVAIHFISNPHSYTIVDHINGDKFNNTVENLRWCDKKNNNLNTKLSSKNTSGHKGVSLQRGLWITTWSQNGISKKESFKNKNDAIEFRNKMVETHYPQEYYTKNR